MAGSPELHKGLSQRHLTMIAMGGVIGAGLFVGSGAVINDAGPAAFVSYALCGVLIVMVMRMLGEMAVANPSTGSFADYARRALGGWAGFAVGWLYWYLDELRSIDAEGAAQYFVCVPANPVDTGQAEHTGAVWVWQETVRAAQGRLDATLATMREHGLRADGELGDHRPMAALTAAAAEFDPDRIVICTHPEVHSAWLRQDVVERARKAFPAVPVRHIVAHLTEPAGG